MSLQSPFLDFSILPPADTRMRDALNAIRIGRPVILMDDIDRENEADLIVAADKITVSTMALLIREGSGIVCLCLKKNVIDRLKLTPMASRNESKFNTQFTISIEARKGVSTGVSAADRVATISAAIAEDASVNDLVSPGHVFPLCAHDAGLLGRRGHTEGSIDLVQIAGLNPAAVLCELMNPDGTMAKGLDIINFSLRHGFPIVSIEEIIHYKNSTLTPLPSEPYLVNSEK